MNRRGFLKLLLPAVGAVAIAPELIAEIWTPRRTIFLPPRSGWRSDYYSIAWPTTVRNFGDIERLISDRMKQDVVRHIDQLAWTHFNNTVEEARHALGSQRR